MGTSFEKRPIKGSEISIFPDSIPAEKN